MPQQIKTGIAPRLDANFSSAPNRVWDDAEWLPGLHRWVLSHFYRLSLGFRRPSFRISQKKLSRRTGLSVPTLRGILRGLESLGLIARLERWAGSVRLVDEYRLLLVAPERFEGVPEDAEPGDELEADPIPEDGGVGKIFPRGGGKNLSQGGKKTAPIEIQSLEIQSKEVQRQNLSANPSDSLELLPSPAPLPKSSKAKKKPPKEKVVPEGYQKVMDAFHAGLKKLSGDEPVYMNGRDGEGVKKLLRSIPAEKVLEGARILFQLIDSGKNQYYAKRGFRSFVLEQHWNEIMREGKTIRAPGSEKAKSKWREAQEREGFSKI